MSGYRVVRLCVDAKTDVYVKPGDVQLIKVWRDFNGLGDDAVLLAVGGIPSMVQVNEPLDAVLRKLELVEDE